MAFSFQLALLSRTMAVNKAAYHAIKNELDTKRVRLVAVSKTKPVTDILALYELGQRDFGENYVQELIEKAEKLPKDIHWHFIGHLQTNKVKLIAPFVQLIHGVDSLKLLKEINKQAEKNNRVIECLLQVYIAQEETKFGLDEVELNEVIEQAKEPGLKNIQICGLMGMASFTSDVEIVKTEFSNLKSIFDNTSTLKILSMGMSSDYKVAVQIGSNMVRIGSLFFGERQKK